MTCPSIGIDPASVGALAGALNAPRPPRPPKKETITAVQTPASSRLYDGQPIPAMTGFAAFTAPANFTSNRGGIANVAVAPLGTAPDLATPLGEGDTAGYRVTVTSTTGGSQSFDTALQTVEFDARVISTSGNEVEVVLNDLVPDAETVDLDITHAPYTGLYTVQAASLRQTAPFVLPGTHRITHSGPASALKAGDVLGMQDPLAHTVAGSLSVPARAWLRNGTPIAGATGPSYTLTAADLGATLTPRATVQDDLGNQTTSDGAAVAIQAATSGTGAPVDLASGVVMAAANAATITINDSALSAGSSVVIAVFAAELVFTSTQLPAATLSSGATVTRDGMASAAGRTNSAIYRYQVGTPGAGKTFTIPSGLKNGEPVFYRVLGFQKSMAVHAANGQSIAGSDAATATLTTAGNSVLVAVGGEERSSSNIFALTFNGAPISNQITQLQSGIDSAKFGFEQITTGSAGTTVAVTHNDGNFHGSVCAVNYT